VIGTELAVEQNFEIVAIRFALLALVVFAQRIEGPEQCVQLAFDHTDVETR
jgi:hypothetical protein